jgi:surface antigen
MSDRAHKSGSRLVATGLAAVLCFGLLACAGGEIGQKEEQGAEIGSIIGGIVAPYIPGSSIGAQIVRNHGDLIGEIIGGAIGASLDEEDRKMLEKSTRTAMTTGKSQTFANKKTGVRGTAKVTATRTNSAGRQCRTVKQEVKLKDGKGVEDSVTACKGSGGEWERSSFIPGLLRRRLSDLA